MTLDPDMPPTVLCVCLAPAWRQALADAGDLRVLGAESAPAALRAMRGRAIDLLVVAAELPEGPFWVLVEPVRRARPGLPWALVGDVTDADEVRARCLGVLMILGPHAGPGEVIRAAPDALSVVQRRLIADTS